MITLNKTSFYNLFILKLKWWIGKLENSAIQSFSLFDHCMSKALFIISFIHSIFYFFNLQHTFISLYFFLVANLFSYNPQRDTLSPSIFDKPSGRLLKGQEDYPYILVPFSHFILCKQSNIHKIILIIFVAFLLREMYLDRLYWLCILLSHLHI